MFTTRSKGKSKDPTKKRARRRSPSPPRRSPSSLPPPPPSSLENPKDMRGKKILAGKFLVDDDLQGIPILELIQFQGWMNIYWYQGKYIEDDEFQLLSDEVQARIIEKAKKAGKTFEEDEEVGEPYVGGEMGFEINEQTFDQILRQSREEARIREIEEQEKRRGASSSGSTNNPIDQILAQLNSMGNWIRNIDTQMASLGEWRTNVDYSCRFEIPSYQLD